MTTFLDRAHARATLLRTTAVAGAFTLGFAAMAAAQSYSFSSVQVNGNQRIEDATVLSYAGLRRGQSISAADLNDAAQALRATNFFETVDVTPRGGALVINVTERPTINRINFEGNKGLKDRALGGLIQSQRSRVFDPAIVEQDTQALARAYAESGRVNAVVTPQIIRRSNNRVDLVFDVAEGGVTEIERISFVGNRTFSDRRLRQVLQTKQAGFLRLLVQRDTYSGDRLNFDKQVLSDFYRSRGYADFHVQNVDVSLSEERDRYLVTFNVQEGQRFNVGKVNIVSEIEGVSAQPFANVMRLRSGQVFSPTAIDADIDRMERVALRNGVNFLRVEPRFVRNDRGVIVDVTYALTEGPKVFIERIDIRGNTATLDRVVRNQFTAAEGDPFNPRQIRESAERVRALGFFANADVNTREGSGPGQQVVDVEVVEKPTGSLTFGGNYSTDNGFGLVASFEETNFLGRGQSLNINTRLSRKAQNLSFSFGEPNLLNRDLYFGLNASYNSTTKANARFDTQTGEFSPSLEFPVSENGRLSVFYGFDYTRIKNVDSAASGIIKREAAQGGTMTHSVGYNYTWDTERGGSVEDKWRFRFSFGQEFGLSNKSQRFVNTTGLAMAQTRVLNEDVTLRATVEGGLLHYNKGNSRITDRFMMGGSIMRGFQPGGIGPRDAVTDDGLGGNMYAVARLEAQFPLGLPEEYGISGGAFVDTGSLWGVGDTTGGTVIYDKFLPRTVGGVSLFWKTPIGPLRFNFTRPIRVQPKDKTRSFDLTLSTTF